MHGLDTAPNGIDAAFFSARIPAWHRLGTVTEGALTAADALRIAHLNWRVIKSDDPVAVPVITPEGVSHVTCDGKYMTYRTNPFTNELQGLGVVGEIYTPFQNEDTFEFLTAVADESGAVFETAGALDGGRRVFVTMKMPDTMLIGGHDAVNLNLIAYTSHDGTTSFGAAVTPIRVVCTNTLTAGLAAAKSQVKFRHTNTIAGRVQQARDALALSFKVAQEFQAEAERLIAAPMARTEFAEFVKALVPVGPDATARMVANAERTHSDLLDLWTAPTQANVANTRWAAYNAVAEWADWGQVVRGGDTGRATRTLTRIIDADQRIKERALRLLSV